MSNITRAGAGWQLEIAGDGSLNSSLQTLTHRLGLTEAVHFLGQRSDVDALYAQGLELGGSEALAPADMPGVGRLAYLHDPDGNVFGLISPVLSDGTTAMGS